MQLLICKSNICLNKDVLNYTEKKTGSVANQSRMCNKFNIVFDKSH